MKKKGGRTRRCLASDFLETPLPKASPHAESTNSGLFSDSELKKISSSIEKRNNPRKKATTAAATSNSVLRKPSNQKTLSTVSDLKEFVSSYLTDFKGHIDHSHSQILGDLESSSSRLHKRLKIQTQSCQRVMDDAEKEYKRMSERISQSQEAMKASYEEFLAHEQASATRACITSINELSQSSEKAFVSLRSRYGISST